MAAIYLQNHGYSIIERNFKARYGEIDIVCVKDGILIFVEVKTRSSEEFGKPEEAVTKRKLAEVIQTAYYYQTTHKRLPDSLRVDVIAIELDPKGETHHFNHIQNVSQ